MCTADGVRLVLMNPNLTDEQLAPFMAAADCIISGVTACATAKGVTAECLETACDYLAAHLIFSTNPAGSGGGAKKMQKFENWSITWATSQATGQGVLASPYGTAANSITQGCLQEADKAPAMVAFFGGC